MNLLGKLHSRSLFYSVWRKGKSEFAMLIFEKRTKSKLTHMQQKEEIQEKMSLMKENLKDFLENVG